ncbi:MAG TPA: hypothetical protein VNF08_02940 [Acidimicrobiales bacterium]|nr:hypothetical protein [Acidimicrobiales bacterium]
MGLGLGLGFGLELGLGEGSVVVVAAGLEDVLASALGFGVDLVLDVDFRLSFL